MAVKFALGPLAPQLLQPQALPTLQQMAAGTLAPTPAPVALAGIGGVMAAPPPAAPAKTILGMTYGKAGLVAGGIVAAVVVAKKFLF